MKRSWKLEKRFDVKSKKFMRNESKEGMDIKMMSQKEKRSAIIRSILMELITLSDGLVCQGKVFYFRVVKF